MSPLVSDAWVKRAGGAYAASKFGVEGLTQVLADEVGEFGIRANSVNPGPTRTEMRARAYPEEDPLPCRLRIMLHRSSFIWPRTIPLLLPGNRWTPEIAKARALTCGFLFYK